MEDLIDEQLRKITERAASADGQFADYREQLRRLRRDIYMNSQLDWNIPDIIKRIGISRSHFQRKYKEQFGVNCLDDVINARMEKAQQLLTGTSMRIVEIAAKCGYSNEVHFMRQFKSRFGIMASQYRKKGTVKE
ncbi:MAG: AraC family transcriptional regulator [Ruminococcus sp.]|nr:AraC family transcriptional regulator [Ruminococcus sp.]